MTGDIMKKSKSPKEKHYCRNCEKKVTFVHKSVMQGYVCKHCGLPWALEPDKVVKS